MSLKAAMARCILVKYSLLTLKEREMRTQNSLDSTVCRYVFAEIAEITALVIWACGLRKPQMLGAQTSGLPSCPNETGDGQSILDTISQHLSGHICR